MKRVLLAALAATSLSAQAQVFEDVTFDCRGALTSALETPEGVRATGQVELNVNMPNGSVWESAGLVVIELGANAAGRDVEGTNIRRCQGRGNLEAQVVDTVKGIDIYELTLRPTEIRVRVGNRGLTDPSRVGFASSASGSPNV